MNSHNLEVVNPFDQGYFESEDLRKFGFKSVGDNVKIAKKSTIIGLENISLASNIRIDDFVVIAAGLGFLNIGNYVHIGSCCYLGCQGGVIMNDFSGISQGVRVYSATDDYSGISLTNPTIPDGNKKGNITKTVLIGRHVIIGSGSVILPNGSIGEGASIGALSLVNKPLDPWCIYVGAPAKKIKERSANLIDLEKSINQIKY